MKNYKLHLSEGFKDTYGNEMLVKKVLENSILNTFKSYGYEHIKTPAVEYIDVYLDGGVQKPDLYNLINRQGEVLALCNDMTSSIARFVSGRAKSEDLMKYCYVADTFRYPRLYQGKNHQFTQAGVELVGKNGLDLDVECIYLAFKSLKNANINDFTIHLGSALFLETLLNDFKVDGTYKSRIYSAIDDKDFVLLKKVLLECLPEEKAKFIVNLILKGGKLKYIENLMNSLEGMKSYDVLCYLKNVYTFLTELGVEQIIFDFSIYAYANYYTGVIFSIYADNVTKELVSGGRCDNLYKDFGKDYNDIGFGLDLDALAQYALDNNLIDLTNEKYVSISDNTSILFEMKNNEEFRNKNITVNHLSLDLDNAISYAKKYGYKKVLSYKNNTLEVVEVE